MKKILIIIGGGYAGIRAMNQFKDDENIGILLIDKQPYQYLQTEAYALIANSQTITHVTVDLPSLCEYNGNASFIRGEVTDINFEEKHLVCSGEYLFYDYLIVSTGCYTNFPRVINGLEEHSVGIKTLKNAFIIRQEFAKQLYALMDRNESSLSKTFNIVVGGAGLSGVEIAAQMAYSANKFLKNNHIAKYKLNIYLIASRENVLDGMNPYLQDNSLKRLRKLGVNVFLKTRIQSVENKKVILNTGKEIEFQYMIFTGGVTTGGFVKKLKCPLSKNGQIDVESTMQIKECENAYAIGDVAFLRDKDGNHAPSTAHAAEQSAQIAAENIKLDMQGQNQKESHIKISGVLVALGGQNASVVLFDKFKFSGKLGYYLKTFITSQYKRHLDKNAKHIHDLRKEEES